MDTLLLGGEIRVLMMMMMAMERSEQMIDLPGSEMTCKPDRLAFNINQRSSS